MCGEMCIRDRHEYEQQRLGVLSRLAQGESVIVCCSVDALLQLTIPKEQLLVRSVELTAGQQITMEDLIRILSAAGYVRRPQVDGSSQFSVRGGICLLYTSLLQCVFLLCLLFQFLR